MSNSAEAHPISHASTVPAASSSIAKNPSTPDKNTPSSSQANRPIARMTAIQHAHIDLPLGVYLRCLAAVQGRSNCDGLAGMQLTVLHGGHIPDDPFSLCNGHRHPKLLARCVHTLALHQIIPIRSEVILGEVRQQRETVDRRSGCSAFSRPTFGFP